MKSYITDHIAEKLNTKAFKTIMLIIGIVSALIPIITSFWNGIDVDTAVILTEMERIYEGYIPYKTIHLNYPPLFFYICVGLKWLFHVPFGYYPFYHALHFVFVIITAVFIYLICRAFDGSKTVSLFCSWLFMMVTHWTQGNYVMFEIPSICFGLAAMYCILSNIMKNSLNFIWIGALTTCAFLVKQFGAGFFVLGLYLIVVNCDITKWKKLLFYILGYLMPILLCLVIWGKDFIYSVLLNGYGTETASLAGYETSIYSKCNQIIGNLYYFSYRICPIVFAAIISIPFIVRSHNIREFLFCIFGILGFALSFWFVRGGLHYSLYMTPFAILMIPIITNTEIVNKYVLWISYAAVALTTLLALYSTYRNRVYKGLKYQQLKGQTELSNRLSEIIDNDKTVWIIHGGIEYLYYFNNLTPPNMSSVGYATGPLEVTKEKQWKQVKSADYIIRFTRDYPYEYSFDEEVKSYVNQFPMDSLDSNGEIVIHRMSK